MAKGERADPVVNPFPPKNRLQALVETLSPEDLLALQVKTRNDGRCGSLQTYDGLPCRRIVKAATGACARHGAILPPTRAKAQRLLDAARTPAVEWIMDQLEQAHKETCEYCGFPHHGLKAQKRIDALAFKLLDRTGFGPRSHVDVTAKRGGEEDAERLVELMTDSERDELATLLMRMTDLRNRVQIRAQRAAEQAEESEAQGLLPEAPTEGEVVEVPVSTEDSVQK
jgi:hypothetical protein